MIATINARFVKVTGEIVLAQYADGAIALCIQDEYEPRPERLSINLIEYDLVAPEGHVYVKEYAEHEGLPDALAAAGVATPTGNQVSYGWGGKCTAQLMKVNDIESLRRL